MISVLTNFSYVKLSYLLNHRLYNIPAQHRYRICRFKFPNHELCGKVYKIKKLLLFALFSNKINIDFYKFLHYQLT